MTGRRNDPEPGEQLAQQPELEILRKAQDRAVRREGVPMFVALIDERSGAAIPVGDVGSESAGALVKRLEHHRSVIARGQRVDDMGFVVSVLAVAALEDFDRNVAT